MLRTLWLGVLLCLGSGVTASIGASEDAVAPASLTPEFQQICRQLASGENAYFSHRLLDQLEAELESANDPARRAGLLGVYGRELLRLGKVIEAVEALESAMTKVPGGDDNDGLRASIHWHLALAHLAAAEDENCVSHRGSDSCIIPFSPNARHELPDHTRRAAILFRDYVEQHPRNVQAAWLLNLTSQLAGAVEVPANVRLPAAAFPQTSPGTRGPWHDRAPELGLATVDLAGGAVVDDFDGDGLLDLVASSWDPCTGLVAFRNDGEGGFEPVADRWGLSSQGGGLNLVHADYDNDGRLDLLVLRGAWLLNEGRVRNSLLKNEKSTGGGLRFRDVTEQAGLSSPAYATQAAAFADFDLDGDLDLYVGNEYTRATPYPSQLFRNRGDGTFEEIAERLGTQNDRYAKAVSWGDYDNDGDPDLYVSNFGANRLYRNDGKSHFVDVAAELGVMAPERESFATWFFDYDNDGDLDLFVADYRSQPARVTGSYFGVDSAEGQPLLYRNELVPSGKVGFREVSRAVGIERPAMPMGANYCDLDNDGWLDFYLGTGEPDLASLMPNQMYRNLGGRFVEVTFGGGFGHLQKGHGIAFGDLDNDGDQDLFHQLGGFYPGDAFGNALFENPGSDNHWLVLRFRGSRSNRFGVGARVEVEVAESPSTKRTIHAVVGGGGSFGSSSLQLEMGLGAAEHIQRLAVRWPSGLRQEWQSVEMDSFYVVAEGEAALEPLSLPRLRLRG